MIIYPYMKYAIRAAVVFLIGWALFMASYAYDIEYTTKMLSIAGWTLMGISVPLSIRAIKESH